MTAAGRSAAAILSAIDTHAAYLAFCRAEGRRLPRGHRERGGRAYSIRWARLRLAMARHERDHGPLTPDVRRRLRDHFLGETPARRLR